MAGAPPPGGAALLGGGPVRGPPAGDGPRAAHRPPLDPAGQRPAGQGELPLDPGLHMQRGFQITSVFYFLLGYLSPHFSWTIIHKQGIMV